MNIVLIFIHKVNEVKSSLKQNSLKASESNLAYFDRKFSLNLLRHHIDHTKSKYTEENHSTVLWQIYSLSNISHFIRWKM